MRYRLLGPLAVDRDESTVDVGPPKQRAVLAMLLLAQGRVVSVDRLIDAVWGDDVPGSATAGLQAYVSNLRRALRDGTGSAQMASPIVRQSPGYYLDVARDDVDCAAFAAGCAKAAAAVDSADWADALAEADAALALWRGPFLAISGTRSGPNGKPRAPRRCDGNAWTAGSLRCWPSAGCLRRWPTRAALRAADPLSDRGCWLHMLALYRSGRAPEALEAYAGHARVLDAELGLLPGAELRELQTAILRQAPELAAWPRPPEWIGRRRGGYANGVDDTRRHGRRVLSAVGADRPRA